MDEYFRFPCPACGKRLKATLQHVGRSARCGCGQAVIVPPPPPVEFPLPNAPATPVAQYTPTAAPQAFPTAEPIFDEPAETSPSLPSQPAATQMPLRKKKEHSFEFLLSVPLSVAVFAVSLAIGVGVPLSVDITLEDPLSLAARGVTIASLVLIVGAAFWVYASAEHVVTKLGDLDQLPPPAFTTRAGHVLLGATYFVFITTIPVAITFGALLYLLSQWTPLALSSPVIANASVMAGLLLPILLGGAKGWAEGYRTTKMAVFTVNRMISIFETGGPSAADEHWQPDRYRPHRWGKALGGVIGVLCGILLGIPLAMTFAAAESAEPSPESGGILVSMIVGLVSGAVLGMWLGYAYGLLAGAACDLVVRGPRSAASSV